MKKMIFASDLFIDDYRGGAELTTAALMRGAPKGTQMFKIHCQDVTEKVATELSDHHWVICNFTRLSDNMKVFFCKNMEYSIIEYDYKFCRYRSLEKHAALGKEECECLGTLTGKINTAFYCYAKRMWFMSDQQKNIFLTKIPKLKEDNCTTLSSMFVEGDLRFIESLKNNEKEDKYLIIGSSSWIKGLEENIRFATENNLDYEVVDGLPYHELIIKLSTRKGLIFRPLGGDTCPRIVIEGKLLGCDLLLNDFVQHKEEEWFATQDGCYEYLKGRPQVFWSQYE